LASARASLRLSKFVPDKFVEPGEIVHTTTLSKNGEGPEALLHFWRRGWDSNPRYGKTVNRISNPAHSTTLPPLRNSKSRQRSIHGADSIRHPCLLLGHHARCPRHRADVQASTTLPPLRVAAHDKGVRCARATGWGAVRPGC